MFYTLIKHGFLTNQSARKVVAILLSAIKNCVLTYGQGERRGIVSTIETVSCGNDPVRSKNGASTRNRARVRLEVQ